MDPNPCSQDTEIHEVVCRKELVHGADVPFSSQAKEGGRGQQQGETNRRELALLVSRAGAAGRKEEGL